MKSLFKHLREMAKHKPRNIYKKSTQSHNYISSVGLILLASGCFSLPAYAEGSRDMYPAGASGDRGSITWSNGTWGGTQNFNNRTLLRVFAKQDEYILMGSSAVNVKNGNILVYNPGSIGGDAAKENLPGTADLSCKTQGSGRGKINNRAEELAGPQSVDGTNNTGGYKPCFYKAPTTGVYYIAMYGPSGNVGGGGANSPNSGIRDNQTIESINTGTNQNTSISAWDVTVRSSDQSSTTDLEGRLHTMLITMNMGGNGKKLNSILYPVTVDGYRYRVTMRGLDPFGFRIFGNQIGNLDSDGKTPLYRDVIGTNGNISTPEGGTSTAPPQFPLFFNPPSEDALSAVTIYDREGKDVGNGIPLAPIPPEVTNPNFEGTSSGNTSTVSTGGRFTFDTNVPANYQIVISRDGVDYDPSNPQNRVLRGSIPIPGQQTVDWNGNDNNAQPFPVGNYPYKVQIQSGEYHFPISDAENNVSGGPTIELLNATNPLGNFTAFFDDRMYTTISGVKVRGNQTYDPDKALCGKNPPNPPFSDPINGGDSSSSTFRNFGTNSGGNTNRKCTGSFGDTKTLDTWIYVPSGIKQEVLNIVEPGFDVSGTLYEDSDGEDDFDTNEPRLPKDITVTLYKDENDNNIIDDGEEIATTVTDDNGDYIFKDVTDGDYKIKVDTNDSEIPSGNTLGTDNDLEITVAGAAVTDQNFGFDKSTNRPLGSPFTCDSTFYITIGNGGGPQQLFDVDRSGSTFNFVPRGSATDTSGGYPAKFDYNALAYNPLDNYLYGYINSSDANNGAYSAGNVVKIGSDGILHSLGKPTNTNGDSLSGSFFAATILSDGTYVIGGGSKFATLDLTTTPPTITNPQTTISGVAFNDFAVDPKDPASLSGKRVYMVNEKGNQDRLVILDMTTFPPQITSQATNPTGQNHNAGSQFVDAFGTLYYRSNSDKKLYRVNSDPNSSDYGKATEIAIAPPGGNHDGASCLFAAAMEKDVEDGDGNLITEIPAGETVKYVYKIATGNVLDLNGVTFTDDLRSVTPGSPINGQFTGNVSVSNGSGNASFTNNNQTLVINNLTLPGQVQNQDANGNPIPETLTITAEVTVPKTTTPGIYNNQSFLTSLPPQYPPSIPSDYPRSAAYEDPTPLDVTEPIANNPNVLLVKRITKINDGTETNGGDNLSIYNQEDSNFYDDNKIDISELPESEGDPKPDTDKWKDTTSDTSSTFLIGGINGGKVEPNDELEYTIYFLSGGDSEAKNVLVCDRIPGNVSFIPTSFNNNQTQAPGGLPGADKGILWLKDGNTQSLTNVGDGDAAQYFPAGVEPSSVYPQIKCSGTNTNGAVVVNLGNLPNATDPGTPNTSYGYIRFRGKVK